MSQSAPHNMIPCSLNSKGRQFIKVTLHIHDIHRKVRISCQHRVRLEEITHVIVMF